MEYLLGVDIGASRLKSAVYTLQGELVALSSREYSLAYPYPGWSEIAPALWWQAFCGTLRDISLKVSLRKIKSVGISSTNATLAIDRKGKILMPGILFNDQRSIEECQGIQKVISEEEMFSITGNRIMPGTCSLATMLWLKNKKRDEYKRVYKFLHPNSYFVYKLTDRIAGDHSRSSPTLLYDINTKKWSRTIAERSGIDMAKLPDLHYADEPIGRLSRMASAETSLSTEALVVTGGNDTACAALGMGVVKNGMAGESMGTSSVLFADVSKMVRDPRLMTMAHVLRNHYLTVAPMSSVGSSLGWFKDEFCCEDRRKAAKLREDVFKVLSQLAATSPPGANGIIFLPYLTGERAPVWDPYAKGLFFGISLRSKKSDFIRAILESAGYGTRWNISVLEESTGTKFKEIISTGGQTKSRLWCQLKSDITRKRYTIPEVGESGTLGAAILAGKGLGVEVSIERKPIQKFCPDSDRNKCRTYERNYELYKNLYFDLKSAFRILSLKSNAANLSIDICG